MEFKNKRTVTAETREQIEKVCEIWQKHLGEDLLGIYIHGSLALDSFKDEVSDIDMLIVVNRRIPGDTRLAIAKEIMEIDQKPYPLEMSALYIKDIVPWQYPTKCQFHYSNYWTEHYRQLLSEEVIPSILIDEDFEDMDIACHVKLAKQCGMRVYGKPEEEIFPDVPEEDFWQSIYNEIDNYDFDIDDPKSYARNLLMLGRILSYKLEKQILTKHDAGVWTRYHIPKEYRYITDNAVKVWFFGRAQVEYKPEDLEGLKTYLIDAIKKD